ncbi:MAG: antibiotic biosynthesis monooxygenase [Chloroflexi bacterium]|nr:antibiotic biosynthesis monooxygenase [Chloroflexota bacterium]
MPFFVGVFQDIRPELLDEMLAGVRDDLAHSYRRNPGRRQSRVFQQIDLPTSFIAISEWDAEEDFQRFQASQRFQRMTVQADPPARIERLHRLRSFARMAFQAHCVACIRLIALPEHGDELEAAILGSIRVDVESSPGLISHDVFRAGAQAGQLVIVHGWESLAALEAFRTDTRERHGEILNPLLTSVERFVGSVTAVFSREIRPVHP